MLLTIEIPPRRQQMQLNRNRWDEIIADQLIADLPYRVETNCYGQLLMSPPASGGHSSRQGQTILRLHKLLNGVPLPECPISTLDGVKVADVGWYSDSRFEQVANQNVFEIAPEICIEVLSPSNSELEMRTKRHLYFEAGAEEVWLCDISGKIRYFSKSSPDQELSISPVCPKF